MFKSIFKTVVVSSVAAVFSIGCGGDDGGGGNPVDPNNPNNGGGSNCSANFRKVVIGTQTWMAENLNCNVSGSQCYLGNADSCTKYGRLYDWDAAMKVCPSGWHLPSDDEWGTLVNYIGDSSTAGKKLKATSGWGSYGNGTDEYGFSALPGGFGFSGSPIARVGSYGYWWSATEVDVGRAWGRDMGHDSEYVGRFNVYKTNVYSVRCVAD